MITQWSRAHPSCAKAWIWGPWIRTEEAKATKHLAQVVYMLQVSANVACILHVSASRMCLRSFQSTLISPKTAPCELDNKNISGGELYCHNDVEIRCCFTYLPQIKSKTMFCVNTAQCHPWHEVGDAGEHPWLASCYLSELYYISGIPMSKFPESSLDLYAA